MEMTEEFNYINFSKMLKALQKQMKRMEDTMRIMVKHQKINEKATRLKRYLTIEEVCDALDLHRNTVYRYIRSGDIPSTVIGRQLYIHEDDLLNLFNRNKREQS